jgi:hypothetical protein
MFFRIVDFNFDPRHLVNFVNDNPVETQIVQVTFIHITIDSIRLFRII